MYIHTVSHYLPTAVVGNEHFTQLNGLSNDWIIERTGIQERRKAAPGENTNTMTIDVIRRLQEKVDLSTVDIIVGATYTPYDTIVSLAHEAQHYLEIADIPVISVSTACSSLLNAIEVVEGYFALNKASRALVIVSEHNTAYNNDQDTISGHLWGDGAAALLITKERQSENDFAIKALLTGGAAHTAKATTAVMMKPNEGGVTMPFGRDVFINACQYMPKASLQVLERCGLTVDDVDYVLPHQANLRISRNVMKTLGLPEEKLISNIQLLGNTGCAGCAIALSENWDMFQKGQRIVLTVFGGGYSYGAMLIEK
ncbi:3-oxoacyl-ACP synthase III family protein [Spirosoma utsteinense]|uniref:3-oxoacyl-[acyl-carrier-protein] synthase-3 n=1 Tax=Spirosoma utsteinense TaxID=2585773 RepID=A0ABR6W1Q2_9BACT|nr:ketoacyl-ACP synthase III [Spirosoma utsteinense]MBC3783810.1 3-oxoacyl-[acyl-carrier-protein] synthase-3 [Spirosoma utsteinense]MBC3790046.1 3-oxoacyl-[acyl-carrier-protein] synthase-3 [Spirosoma utsteinense]